MIIAFEGMDGTGKTTVAVEIARILNFEFVQKPMRMLFDRGQEDVTAKILAITNEIDDKNFGALFLGSVQYYQSKTIQNKNVVLDRYLSSNYYHHSNESNIKYFDCLVELCEKPDLTIVLYASSEERKKRIMDRNGSDGDLSRFEDNDLPYEKIKSFLERYNMPYMWLDSTKMTKEEVVERVIERVNDMKIDKRP